MMHGFERCIQNRLQNTKIMALYLTKAVNIILWHAKAFWITGDCVYDGVQTISPCRAVASPLGLCEHVDTCEMTGSPR